MATQLRILDDAEDIGGGFKEAGGASFGEVTQSDGAKLPLYLRDMTNKVMHAATFKWDLSIPDEPKIVCLPHNAERWTDAKINVVALMTLIGNLIY